MTDGDRRPSLEDLESRLEKAREKSQPRQSGLSAKDGNALGVALRLGVEFVAGIAVGSIIGFFLDRWLGTTPWLFLVFFMIGTGSGFMNVFRTAKNMGLMGPSGSPKPENGGQESRDAGSND
jgi:ATP synthase protein I